MSILLYKELSYNFQGACFTVYKTLGNAFKENIYHNALLKELEQRNITVENQKRLNIYYLDQKVGTYVPDIIIENRLIAELKAKPFLTQNDVSQFWYYLKGSNYKVGYLVNFGSPKKVELIRRVYDTARQI